MKIGMLGCGKIGQAIVQEALSIKDVQVSFLQDTAAGNNFDKIPFICQYDEKLYRETDLVIECATADAAKENLENILKHCDLMMFSATAFAEKEFEIRAKKLCEQYNRKIYLPHGAILGLDGIFDGRNAWREVEIETVKNPQSLGRKDLEVTVVYEGTTRGACEAYPRNVNVHAEIAMAGIGFDKTKSVIISDPAVNSNTHHIRIKGDGISVKMEVSSFTTGGVTGIYTPLSAIGSLHRIVDKEYGIRFV